jgi:hypothetical protein
MYCKVAYVVIVGTGCSINVAGVNVLCSGYETRSYTVRSTVEQTASTILNIHSANRSVY